MDPDVQAFLDTWAAKSAAKQETLIAVGAAKFAEADGRPEDAARLWRVVEDKGINGEEGALYNVAFAIAESYVANHPEQFEGFERYVNPDDHAFLVELTGLMGKRGRVEEEAKLTMFELVRFERQHIGAERVALVRKLGA